MKTTRSRILIDASAIISSHKSGVAKTVEALISELGGLKSPFEIVLFAPFDKTKILEDQFNLPVKKVPIPDYFYRGLRKFDILPPLDLLLGRGVYIFPNYWNSRLLFSKSVTIIYDLSFLLFPAFVEPKNRVYLSRHIRHWVNRTTQIVTISEYLAEQITNVLKMPRKDIRVVYPGVNRRLYMQQEPTIVEKALEGFGLHKPYILTVGNIEPRKNLETLIQAYLNSDISVHNKYTLVLVANGGWNNEALLFTINKAISDGYDIRILSSVLEEQLIALYSGAAVYTQLSYYEGFGLTPLEAMACGAPVLLSDISVFREVFGDCVEYVNPNNDKAVQQAMSRILRGNSNVVGSVKRTRLFDKYDWRIAAHDLLDITREITGK